MLLVVFHFIRRHWVSCIARASRAWRAILRLVADPPPPLTSEQLKTREEEFISSIDRDAVCALASRYNHQKPCRIINSARGSFNVCFFVHFYTTGTKWVVRIPIEPAIYNVWEKLQSEVATMRYIESHTKIPVPRIHAYGRSRMINCGSATQAFLIIDWVSGRSLDMKSLVKATRERRNHFYSDLIDVLAQLRRLEFPVAGSLMPNFKGGSEPVGKGAPRATFNSATQLVHQNCNVLSETYRLPTEELSRQTAELEIFALDSLEKQVPNVVDARWDDGPFVLTHTDLRCANIIIDDDFRIRGVIDWEWASTVPRQFFTPPLWITGHALEPIHGISLDMFSEFRDVLHAKGGTSRDYEQLLHDWDFDQKLTLPMAQILRHPSSLLHVFYTFIYPGLFLEPRDKVVAKFFKDDENGALAIEVQRRIDISKRYTQYLKDNGLFVEDEESQKLREWLAKGRELERKLGLTRSN
ncbi:phosphotransferase enzyme family protein [Hirsutella rhossiliensis]|uniref:Phosphotransferase enzyme family domain-containing protein n=1 Tax=Hirsutella rhossiliensis TaxID=111463 RepID=A0A9P8MV01_9HYPO|nr:phosphotransferase enzyme family domain-containing protein [Hirsutella rhossiliensis]KAH0961725.1 phosphotransferase enzyme family domain-containing protein [Hirsutella rhossiliensis]